MSDSESPKRTSWNGVAIALGRMVELAREAGAHGRSVGLKLHKNGNLAIDSYDSGPVVEEVHGDGDYERFCTIAAEDVPRLAAALLHAEFEGDLKAVDRLKAFCDAYGIEARITSW